MFFFMYNPLSYELFLRKVINLCSTHSHQKPKSHDNVEIYSVVSEKKYAGRMTDTLFYCVNVNTTGLFNARTKDQHL